MQQRIIGILALTALIVLSACGGGGPTSSSAPSNVRTQAGDGYVTVTWDFSGSATTFEIYRETIGGATLGAQALEKIDTVEDGSAREYEDIGVDSSATYAYGVSANGGEVVSAGGSGVSPDPGNDLRVLFGTAPPQGATVSITSDPSGIDCAQSGQTGCDAEFATIVDVVLTADTSPGTAATWENCDTSDFGTCQVSMATSRTVTVNFMPANTLSVDVLPAGTGRVESTIDLGSNPAVSCTNACTYNYPSGISIPLIAEPIDSANFQLAGWGGVCAGSNGSTCNVSMDASKALSAQFELIPPTIQTFTAVPARLTAGQSSTLSWDVTGGGDLGAGELSISIDPEVGAVPSRTGAVQVTPAATTMYTITATNATETVSATRTVVVGNGALIESFTATPEAINPSGTSTLAWTVSGTNSPASPLTLTLNPGGIDVTGMSSYPVEPDTDTTYTLTAENEFGPDSDTVEVRVGNAPLIGSFEPLDAFITPDESTILEWDVSGPGTITLTLDPGGQDVTGATSAPVDPEATTEYTLIAESEFGITTDTTIVNVGARPTISEFEATPELIATGDSTTLSWAVTGPLPITLAINQGVGDVTGLLSKSVSPGSTVTYTLTATNAYGEASRDETVTVGDAPSIGSFSADDTTVTSGADVALSWSVSNTDSLTLDPGGLDMTGLSGTTVNPLTDVTYTLTATNAFDSVTDTVQIVVGDAPNLSNLMASPSTITSDESSTLSWEIVGTDPIALSIDQGVGDVTGETSVVVSPDTTTTYALSATNDFGSDSATTTVTVEPLATSLIPSASTCDGVGVDSSCVVTISLVNTATFYEGLEFDFASTAFDLTSANASSETSGCFVDAGSTHVLVACPTAFGAGDVASLSVQRTASSSSTFETSGAYVASDDTSKTAVNGGILLVGAAD